ncbi:TNFAIP3-interacting protein 3 isoform X2 [Aotus nancymaae]|uniref:TNFAIP3-interacting protein 3 isoform X2 n=1 Tax=Aotus nancymaae TaxID=37293 RepID=UPI0030FF0363
MIPCGWFINKNEKRDDKLIMFTNQSEDSERCESIELDKKIQDLIERNASPHPKGVTPEAMTTHRNPCSPKTPGKRASMAHFVQNTSRMIAAESSTKHEECAESSTRKNLTNSLEQKIKCLEKQRKELLEVNQQWDQQFRSMKELYERKVAELKTKLDAAERFRSTREKERHQRQREDDRERDLTRDLLQREEKEKERLNEELHELKKANKLLKENNALANKEKEHYECEIKRLNKALQDALNIKCSFSEDCLRKCQVEFCHEEMITEMEVLKQQIKACQMEKEKLEKQLKQMYFSTCNCGLVFHLQDSWVPTGPGTVQKQQEHPPDYQWYALDQLPPDVQHKANGFSSKKKVNQ